jgi:hypothetical protein
MLVRVRFTKEVSGFAVGDVRRVAPHVAERLVAAGEAERVTVAEAEAGADRPASASASSPPAAKPKRRARKK